MRRIIATTALGVTALLLAACDPGDIDAVLGELPSEDLTQSQNPSHRAAGETAVEILSAREAERNVEIGFVEQDLDAIRQAQRLRPWDPRYVMAEAALLPDGPERDAVLRRGHGLTSLTVPEVDDSASYEVFLRTGQENYLNALRDLLQASADFPGRDAKVGEYCQAINSDYPGKWSGVAATSFLAFEVDRSLCG